MREANEAFVEAYHLKTLEKSEKMEQRDLNSKSLMSEANALYEKIVQIVNAYAIVQTSDQIETFITEVKARMRTLQGRARVQARLPALAVTTTGLSAVMTGTKTTILPPIQ